MIERIVIALVTLLILVVGAWVYEAVESRKRVRRLIRREARSLAQDLYRCFVRGLSPRLRNEVEVLYEIRLNPRPCAVLYVRCRNPHTPMPVLMSVGNEFITEYRNTNPGALEVRVVPKHMRGVQHE